MDADDIPTSITKLSETAPNVAMTDTRRAAWALAHFWPAIEQHILTAAADRVAELATANDGQLICATRAQILNAIRGTQR